MDSTRFDNTRIDEANKDYGIDALKEIIETHNVTTAVIGLPKNMNNTIGPSGEASLHFSEILKSACPALEIVMWDERLSTVGAERSLLEADVSRKSVNKSLIRWQQFLYCKDT